MPPRQSRSPLSPVVPTLLPGTLDMLLLAVLDREPLHGYALARTIESLTQTSSTIAPSYASASPPAHGLMIEEGSLYPALTRLSRQKLIQPRPLESPAGRPRRIYEITILGRRELHRQIRLWQHTAAAIDRVLFPSGAAM